MSVRGWLASQGLADQAQDLADIDVFSMSDLGVRIYWEDTEKEKVTMPFVPEVVREAYKKSIAAHMWSGDDLEVREIIVSPDR